MQRLIRTNGIKGITTNIACPFSISIPQLVNTFELVTGKKANYSIVEGGGRYKIDSNIATEAAKQIGVNFDDSYIEKLIRKYYGK